MRIEPNRTWRGEPRHVTAQHFVNYKNGRRVVHPLKRDQSVAPLSRVQISFALSQLVAV